MAICSKEFWINKRTSKKLLKMKVLIGGYIKSGTTLIAKLLDGVDGVVMFPEETAVNKYYIRSKDNMTLFKKVKNDNRFLRLNQAKQQSWLFGNRDYSNFDFKKFVNFIEKDLEEIDKYDPLTVIFCIVENYAKIQRIENAKILLEKTPGNEILFKYHLKKHRENKAIYIKRNPEDIFSSVRKKRLKQNLKFNLKKSLHSWIKNYQNVINLKEIYGKQRLLILDYDELTVNPKKTMENVANFLNIKFSEVMLSPTIMGEIWEGNSMKGKKFSKIESFRSSNSNISDKEKSYIKHFYDYKYDKINYLPKNLGCLNKYSLKLFFRHLLLPKIYE